MPFEVQSICPLIQVFDMNTSLKFYCDLLGFTIHASTGETDDPGWAWLKWNDIHLMLNTAYETPDRPLKPDPTRMAAHGDTTLYFACPNVDEAYNYLRSKGSDISLPIVTSYGMKQLYLHDPDGYNLCFQWTA